MNLAFIASATEEALQAQETLQRLYTSVAPEKADVIIVLGGDGFMLKTLHQFQALNKPVYGINCGTVGFLMNAYQEEDLLKRLKMARETVLHPLKMTATDVAGKTVVAHAINEVSLLRHTAQAAKIRIYVDGVARLDTLVCDGILIATPAGSTAYNLSAHGPIIPINANLLALTPISAFRPRRWRGALLPDTAQVTLEILEADKRPVSASADDLEVRDVQRVEIHQDPKTQYRLLFDPHHNLEERILGEQFLV
ncbi:MAG: NAD kinase [Alphaproteobacteria bacterium]|jgi:NAD+ kinase|nr:NAD kinase [Alphaproteobacteria bacterium]